MLQRELAHVHGLASTSNGITMLLDGGTVDSAGAADAASRAAAEGVVATGGTTVMDHAVVPEVARGLVVATA